MFCLHVFQQTYTSHHPRVSSCGFKFGTTGGSSAFERGPVRKSCWMILILSMHELKKQKNVTTTRNTLKKNHLQNLGMRIHSNASHPTIPEKWNTIIVLKFMSAMDATTWQNAAVKNKNMIGDECWKGLRLEPSYMIPIEPNSTVTSIVYALHIDGVVMVC